MNNPEINQETVLDASTLGTNKMLILGLQRSWDRED